MANVWMRQNGQRDALAIRMAARHGFRVSELCELRWDPDLAPSFQRPHALDPPAAAF